MIALVLEGRQILDKKHSEAAKIKMITCKLASLGSF